MMVDQVFQERKNVGSRVITPYRLRGLEGEPAGEHGQACKECLLRC